jgi:hypothetical protein
MEGVEWKEEKTGHNQFVLVGMLGRPNHVRPNVTVCCWLLFTWGLFGWCLGMLVTQWLYGTPHTPVAALLPPHKNSVVLRKYCSCGIQWPATKHPLGLTLLPVMVSNSFFPLHM